MQSRPIKKGKSEAQMQGLGVIPGKEQSVNALVYSPSFQQSAVHEFLSQRRYLYLLFNLMAIAALQKEKS